MRVRHKSWFDIPPLRVADETGSSHRDTEAQREKERRREGFFIFCHLILCASVSPWPVFLGVLKGLLKSSDFSDGLNL
jgi:hypothetical protein